MARKKHEMSMAPKPGLPNIVGEGLELRTLRPQRKCEEFTARLLLGVRIGRSFHVITWPSRHNFPGCPLWRDGSGNGLTRRVDIAPTDGLLASFGLPAILKFLPSGCSSVEKRSRDIEEARSRYLSGWRKHGRPTHQNLSY